MRHACHGWIIFWEKDDINIFAAKMHHRTLMIAALQQKTLIAIRNETILTVVPVAVANTRRKVSRKGGSAREGTVTLVARLAT